MEAVNEPVMLMEIERELYGPNREEALARRDAVLAGLGRRIDDAMKSGLPPDEYSMAVELKEANVLARKILRLTGYVDGKSRKAAP